MTRATATDRIRARLRSLLERTVANGCTEHEALAAAELAAELMSAHGLTEADITMDEEAGGEAVDGAGWRIDVVATIGACTNSASILCADGWHFIGRTPGPQVANYLRAVLFRAIEAECVRFRAGKVYKKRRTTKTRRQASADFRTGIVAALCARLRVIYRAKMDPAALAQARQALAQRYPRTKTVSAPKRAVRFDEAVSQGHHAGRAVALHHAVDGPAAAPALLIGPRA